MARTKTQWLRVTLAELQRRELVTAYLPAVRSEGERNYQLWERGLILAEAQACAAGAQPPPGLTVDALATRAMQELIALLPLLRATGRLGGLGLADAVPVSAASAEGIDGDAADDVMGLGGIDFL